MTFEEQEQIILQHTFEHFQNNITSVDHSCQICYSPPLTVPSIFDNFWNWISVYYTALSYTSYTVIALGIYCRAYLNDSNTVKSGPVIKLARQLLFSIRFEIHPIDY